MTAPTPENDYLVTSQTRLDAATLNAILGSIAERLRGVEALEDPLQAVIDAGLAQAAAAVQAELGPYAEQAGDIFDALQGYLATYEAGSTPIAEEVLTAMLGGVEARGDTLAKLLALIDGLDTTKIAGLAAALAARAPLASPAFTGTPTAPTPALDDESTRIATTAYVSALTRAQAVDTIAQLRTRPVQPGKFAIFADYYGDGFGGGGVVHGEAGDPGDFVENYGSSILPSNDLSGAVRWRRDIFQDVDARQFGIRGDGTDQTERIMRGLRLHMRDVGDCKVIFPGHHGEMYCCRSPKPFHEVLSYTVDFQRAKLKNIGAIHASEGGTYGASTNYGFQFGSDDIGYSWTPGGQVAGNPVMPDPASKIWDDPGPGVAIVATSGYLMTADVPRGSRTVPIAPADAANVAPGAWVLLHWFVRQIGSNPMNPAYFEYRRVEAVDAVTGVLTLDEPTTWPYKIIAPQDTHRGLTHGPARVTLLDRADYRITRKIRVFGGEILRTSNLTSYGGLCAVIGALDAVIDGMRAEQYVPSMCRFVEARGCEFFGPKNEVDKMMELARFVGTRVVTGSGSTMQGSGARRIEFIGGSIENQPGQTGPAMFRSRELLLEGAKIATNGTTSSPAMVVCDSYAGRERVIEDCEFAGDGSQAFMLQAGSVPSFFPDAVTPTSMTIAAGNPAMTNIRFAADYGGKITVNTGATAEVFTIDEVDGISWTPSGDLVLTGAHEEGTTPAPASTQRVMWSCRHARVDESNRLIAGGIPAFGRHRARAAYDTAEAGGAGRLRTYRMSMRNAGLGSRYINGDLIEVVVDVLRPYRGTDPASTLDLRFVAPNGTTVIWSSAINVRQRGTRIMRVGGTAGSQSGDSLSNIPSVARGELLNHYVRSSGVATYTDATPAALPDIVIVAYLMAP